MVRGLLNEEDIIINQENESLYEYDKQDLYNNTSPRCPVVLLIDVSTSMNFGKLYDNGELKPIDEINKGIKYLFDYIRNDFIASKRCEVAVVTFGSKTTIVTDFSMIDHKKDIHLKAKGKTLMVPAIKLALEMVENRKAEYRNNSRKYYRPMVFLFTDGGPDPSEDIESMKKEVFLASKNKKLQFFALKIGVEKNKNLDKKHFQVLESFDCKIPASRLAVEKFPEFFRWLSNSIGQRVINIDTDDDSFANPTDEKAGTNWWERKQI